MTLVTCVPGGERNVDAKRLDYEYVSSRNVIADALLDAMSDDASLTGHEPHQSRANIPTTSTLIHYINCYFIYPLVETVTRLAHLTEKTNFPDCWREINSKTLIIIITSPCQLSFLEQFPRLSLVTFLSFAFMPTLHDHLPAPPGPAVL